MTSSRIVRGTKIRIFVCFCAVVVVLGILACYNNTISRLDETQKAIQICHQQQENLLQQLQVVSDIKQRLESAIKEEKAGHAKSNSTFNQAIKDEQVRNDKKSMDASLRYDSMKQRYNLLQTEYEDYKTKQARTLQEHLDQISDLQVKLKEAQENIKKIEISKEKLKTDYINNQVKTDDLKKQLELYTFNSIGNENKTNYLHKQNIELKREIESIKDKCPGLKETDEAVVNVNNHGIANVDENSNVKDMQVDQNVRVIPIPNNAMPIKPSSTTSSVKQSSRGSLNGARPLALPTMTPGNVKKSNDVLANPNSNKVAEGVLPVPDSVPVGVVPVDKSLPDNQISNDIIDNRYQNKIDVNLKKPEEMENENVGNEDLEQPNVGDELGFGESIKKVEKQNKNKQHIDNLAVHRLGPIRNEGILAGDYKERQNDQLEDNVGIDEVEDGKLKKKT
ncbi:hypothetical protein WA026_020333 [Henosepilachna vigintioctopunctata]|uniref:Golgi integral membrane protein 4 n=1 Tax=Henosepilachna vigintioctopunctata TaxID=420089 RepID=A0AAW1TZ41_9CUCU